MKIGFDIHGVVDTFEVFAKMTAMLSSLDDVEVHIITGHRRDSEIEEKLEKLGVKFDKYFSIVDYLESKGDEVTWKGKLPFANKTEWDRAKADYCEREEIDILFDDSPIYGSYFSGISTVFSQVINPERKKYHTR